MTNRREKKKPRRRWWQLFCRTLVVLLIVLIGGYATLPWWLPSGIVKQWMADSLSEQMGVPVRVAKVTVSWAGGIEFHDVVIDSPSGFKSGTMLKVPLLRADFSPLTLLWTNRLSWAELDSPTFVIEADENGQLNTNVFRNMVPDPDSKQDSMQIDRATIRNAKVVFDLPGNKKLLVLGIADLQILAGSTPEMGGVTMSAQLRQEGGDAPISLRVDSGIQHHKKSAVASFSFSGIDIGQLSLGRLIKLPVRKFTGVCSGSVELEFDRGRDVVNRADCRITIANLDIQPLDEDVNIPVVDKAELTISSTYDPYHPAGARIVLKKLQVEFPGMSLAGTAAFFGETFDGRWQGIEELQLTGQVDPSRLAMLFSGKKELYGDVDVGGPVGVGLQLRHKDNSVSVTIFADATSAGVSHKSVSVKPAGLKLRAELSGELDDRKWSFDVKRCAVSIGDNTFSGKGKLGDVRELAAKPDEIGSLSEFADHLEGVEWQGEMQVKDVASLRQLLATNTDVLKNVSLGGGLSGRFAVSLQPEARITGSLDIPADSSFSVGKHFTKPSGKAVKLIGGISLSRKTAGFHDIELVARIGDGKFVLDHGQFSAIESNGNDGDVGMEMRGHFEVDRVEQFAACLPELKGTAAVRGGLNGNYMVRVASGVRRAHLAADLTKLQVDASPWFVKKASEQTKLAVDFLYDASLPPAERNYLGWRLDGPCATIGMRCVMGPRKGDSSWQGRVDISGKIAAGRLVTMSPKLSSLLDKDRLGGDVSLAITGSCSKGRFSGEASIDADSLEFVSSGSGARGKRKGTPLRIRLVGEVISSSERSTEIKLSNGSFDFGTSFLRTSLALRISPQVQAGGSLLSPGWCQGIEGELTGRVSIDEAFMQILPEMKSHITKHKLKGTTCVRLAFKGDRDGFNVKGHLDADKLGGSANVKTCANMQGVVGTIEITKPIGMAAPVDFEASLTRSLSRLTLNDLRAQVGCVRLLGGGSMKTNGDASSLPTKVNDADIQVSAWTKDASGLSELCPDLKEFKLGGKLQVETKWSLKRPRVLQFVSCRAEDLRGRLKGKGVRIGGELLLRDVEIMVPVTPAVLEPSALALAARDIGPGQPELLPATATSDKRELSSVVSGIKTEGLHVQVGWNSVWLIADVTDLLTNPRGKAYVLGEYLDLEELGKWFAEQIGQRRPPRESRTEPVNEKKTRAAAAQVAKLLKQVLGEADLKVVAKFGQLRTRDPSVGFVFDLRNVLMDLSASAGKVVLSYGGGLNGGLMRGGVSFDLTEGDNPNVLMTKTLKDVGVDDGIRAQMEKFFPGNIVKKFFNREESLNAPLKDVVANGMDWRCPLLVTGSAKTVAIGGRTSGRAAPEFITNIFPGLNLTTYNYDKMTAFTEYLKTGKVKSDMIFNAKNYDVFITGTTNTKNIAKYDVGIILLSSLQTPKMNHELRQGRVPIFKFGGRIEDGKMYDVTITYPWPTESLYMIFLSNNPLYRSWLLQNSNANAIQN